MLTLLFNPLVWLIFVVGMFLGYIVCHQAAKWWPDEQKLVDAMVKKYGDDAKAKFATYEKNVKGYFNG